jgi:hypothetical protein
LCTLIFKFLIRQENKRIWTEWYYALPKLILFLISSLMQYLILTVIPKYWNSATFLKDLFAMFTLFHPTWWTTLWQLSATVHSIHFHQHSISRSCLLHLQAEDMPCHGDKGPTYHRRSNLSWEKRINVRTQILVFWVF